MRKQKPENKMLTGAPVNKNRKVKAEVAAAEKSPVLINPGDSWECRICNVDNDQDAGHCRSCRRDAGFCKP